jgi:uncharacterized glyoxalase superfamily protein PhnB
MSRQPTFVAYPSYLDPKAAIAFLEAAFGFETAVLVLGDADEIVHAEMSFGDGRIGIGAEWQDNMRSPKHLGGKCSCSIHVQLESGLDAHCQRARAAGATIIAEPETKPYGDRTYVAVDPEGNVWSFGETVDAVVRDSWDAPGIVTRQADVHEPSA